MAVWRLEDDCLAPSGKIVVEFKGKNPFAVYKALKDSLKKVFGVGSSAIWERDFRWDITSDPRSFFVRYFVKKGIDMRSSVLSEIILEGEQPSTPEKDGKIRITIKGKLVTEYERKTTFQNLPIYKGLLLLYNFIFYNRVRRNYLALCIDWLTKLEEEFRSILSMPKIKS
jgi:hypothetical protein